jgi:hypothetical protein
MPDPALDPMFFAYLLGACVVVLAWSWYRP